MAGEAWSEEPFEEVIDFQEGPGILAKDFRDEGIPLVRLSGLERGASVLNGCNFLDPSTVSKRWAHFRLSQGDILLSTSASLGRIAVVGSEAVGAVPYTGIIRMRPRDRRLYAPFIRYLLEGPDFQRQAEMAGVGSVIRHFGPMHLRQMTVRLPSFEEQCAIAQILGTLDDKIELNRRMSETLEAIARALFQSWFVDFDPVRAKSEGRDTGLPKHIADLFPDGFEESELGEIPRGWHLASLGQMASIQGGKQLPAEDCRPSGRYPVYGANGLMGYADNATHAGFVIAFGRVGAYCGSVHWVYSGAWINNNASAVTSAWPEFVLQSMLGINFESMRTGSAQPFIPNASLSTAVMMRPRDPVLEAFSARIRPIRLKQAIAEKQCGTLHSLRDTLLRKLVTGEVRIKNLNGEFVHA